MNDFELESKLKSVPLPARSPEYWNDFPSQVRARLRRAPMEMALRHSRLPHLAWGAGFAMACIIFCLAAWPAFCAAVQNGKTIQHELAQLPGHLRVVLQDEHGMHYLIADQP